jgi:LuxR family transcriptional regulator, maltose regulon positive regulatory protein
VLCIRANIASHRRDYEKALQLSERANIILTMGPDKGLTQPQRHFLGLVKFNLALAYELSGDLLKATEAFAETITLEQGTRNPHIFPMANGHLAQLEVIQGHLRTAADIYNRTLNTVANLPHPTPLAGLLLTGLGDIHYEWNGLDKALAYYKQGIEKGKIWNNWETLVPGYLGLARIEIASGNIEGAQSRLDELEQLRQKIKLTEEPALVNAYRAWIWVLQGKREVSEKYLETHPWTGYQNYTFLQEPEVIMWLRTFQALGNPNSTLKNSQDILARAQSGKRWGRVIEILALQSCWLYQLGEKEKAVETLLSSLKLAEPEGNIRSIIDGGQPVMKMLEIIREKGDLTGYSRKLLETLHTPQKSQSQKDASFSSPDLSRHPTGLIEPLSSREIEVLRLLSAGKTNQEIADNLFLSLNTVKTHVKNIHTKLGSRNRIEAASRAQELGLL